MSIEIPRAIEEEKALLGSMIVYNDIIDDVIVEIGNEDVFSIEQNRLIYKAIVDLNNIKQGVIDPITLRDFLKKKKSLTKVGGIKYINSLLEVESFNALSYTSIIKEKYILRKLLEISDGLKSEVLSGTKSPDEVLDNAERTILNIKIKNTEFEMDDINDIAKSIVVQVGEIYETKKPIMSGINT
ncbi:hypothetical protein KAU43_01845, partial [candidate division WOR-3 bacterium]|nr:hypothetical protein [candidate division WOR-3 bacterium]